RVPRPCQLMHALAPRHDGPRCRHLAADLLQARRYAGFDAGAAQFDHLAGRAAVVAVRDRRAETMPALHRASAGQIQEVEDARSRRHPAAAFRRVTEPAVPILHGREPMDRLHHSRFRTTAAQTWTYGCALTSAAAARQ